MSALRTVITSMLVFTLLGIVMSTFFGPKLLVANLCGITQDAMTSRPCVQTVEEATTSLVRYQLYGAGGGATMGLVIGIAFLVNGRKKHAPEPAKPATQPTPPPSKPA